MRSRRQLEKSVSQSPSHPAGAVTGPAPRGEAEAEAEAVRTVCEGGMQPADPDSTEGEENAAVLVFVPGRRHCEAGTGQRSMGGTGGGGDDDDEDDNWNQVTRKRTQMRRSCRRSGDGGGGEGGRGGEERQSLKGWMAGGSAAQEQSDQIRSDHGMSFQSTSDSLGCLGAGMHGWMDTVDTQLHGHTAKSKQS